MSIERRTDGAKASADAVVELVLRGRIDAESGAELEHAVAEELRRGHHAIRLDCSGVSFLSSAGIRVLFNVHRAAKAAGGTCLIGAASDPVARVLEMTRLAPILREPQGPAEPGHAVSLRAAMPAGKPAAAAAARWLSFSREPVHARQTALVVGVVCRGLPSGGLADFVRPLGPGGPSGHAHAVVFPSRPLKRGGVDLAATVTDLSASEPLAVMHLIGDPHPVLGSGQSEFVRGCCWFAPLVVAGRTDGEPAA